MAQWIYLALWNIHLFLFQEHLLLIDLLRIETRIFVLDAALMPVLISPLHYI